MSTIIKHKEFTNHKVYKTEVAGRPLTMEVGKLAELANAAVMVGYGDTRVLCCVTAAPRPRDGIDFFTQNKVTTIRTVDPNAKKGGDAAKPKSVRSCVAS